MLDVDGMLTLDVGRLTIHDVGRFMLDVDGKVISPAVHGTFMLFPYDPLRSLGDVVGVV